MRLVPILLLLLLAVPAVFAAVDFNQQLSPEDEQQFDQILQPVMKVYNFIKYVATVIAVLAFVFAGITFVTSGGDVGKKERAKNMGVGVVVGLIVIWVAPLFVRYIFS